MKPRKISKARIFYSSINEGYWNFHFIIDENGVEKHISKNPYWMPIGIQPDNEAIYISVIQSQKADKEKQDETLKSILSRFEGISVIDSPIDILEAKHTLKEAKKSKKNEE
jgi:hypothetical protein